MVGAGLAGMSAAALLARQGWSVDCFEAMDHIGGKAGSLSIDGYRFDTGPSLFTMPEVFGGFFQRMGSSLAAELNLIPLDPLCRYHWPDGTVLDSSATKADFIRNLERSGLGRGAELEAYLAKAKRVWRIAGSLFLENSLQRPATYLRPRAWPSILQLPAIRPFATLHGLNRKAFADPRMVQLFDRYATYNGSDPYRTPGTMRIIPHVEYAWGGYALSGGIASVPRAIERVARNAGVRFHLASPVERIILEGRRVRGVMVQGRLEPCDICISNADVLATYQNLLDKSDAPEARRYARLEPSSSGIVFLWGIRRRFPSLQSHNIFFSGDYQSEFGAIFGKESVGSDPTVYINITSLTNPSDAPEGCENWFVLVNCAPDRGQDWPELVKQTRARVLARLGKDLGLNAEDDIACERVLDPRDIAATSGSLNGSLYGIASNSPMSAFLRHANRSRRFGGLYFAGGSAHPGGGMPLAVLSGSIVADLVEIHEHH